MAGSCRNGRRLIPAMVRDFLEGAPPSRPRPLPLNHVVLRVWINSWDARVFLQPKAVIQAKANFTHLVWATFAATVAIAVNGTKISWIGRFPSIREQYRQIPKPDYGDKGQNRWNRHISCNSQIG